MNIEIRRTSGKRKACYVDGKKIFEMHKSQHKAFNTRVERLRKQERVNTFIATKRLELLAQPDCGAGIYIEPVPSAVQNQAAASIAKIEGAIERNRRFDQSFNQWISEGMPVFIPVRPSLV
jgi:hypothetical protein